MANPQVGNGHIEIANDIVSHLARTQLSGYESRIIWALWRKTWGWVVKNPDGTIKRNKKGKAQKKKSEFISLPEWEKMTEIKKPHICRTLAQLEARCIVTKNGNGSYGFQKDFHKWLPPTKKTSSVTKNGKALPKMVIETTAKEEKPRTTGKDESSVTKNGNGVKTVKKGEIVTKNGNGVTKNGNFAEPQTTPDKGSRVSKETLLERKKRSTVPIRARAQGSGSLSCNPTSGQESKPESDEESEQVGASPAPTGGARSGLKPIGSSHPVDLPRLSADEIRENRKKLGGLGRKLGCSKCVLRKYCEPVKKAKGIGRCVIQGVFYRVECNNDIKKGVLQRRGRCMGCRVREMCAFRDVDAAYRGPRAGQGECIIDGKAYEVKCGDEVRKKELLAMVEKRKKSDRSVESDKSEVK